MTTVRRPNGSVIGTSIIPTVFGQVIGSGIWDKNEHYSLSSSGFVLSPSYQANILLVAGGGGGGGGGGGAGGLILTTVTMDRASYNITVGSGGSAARDGGNTIIAGGSLSNITALGGGAGGGNSYGTAHSGNDGHSGGSGGGAAMWNGGGVATYPGAATQPSSQWGGYGNSGSIASPYNRTGSGGGAGGGPTVNTATGQNNGGIGIYSSIIGTSAMYSAGGSVNTYYVNYNTTGTGAVNSGNGGGLYAAGGSGILVISYKSPTQQGTGGTTYWYVDGNDDKWWVHKFTNSGTYSG